MLVDLEIGYVNVILQFLQAVSNLWIQLFSERGGSVNHAIYESYSILVQSPSLVIGEYIRLCW